MLCYFLGILLPVYTHCEHSGIYPERFTNDPLASFEFQQMRVRDPQAEVADSYALAKKAQLLVFDQRRVRRFRFFY